MPVPVLSEAEFAGIANHAKSLESLVNAHLSLGDGYGTVLWDGWMWETSCPDFLPRVHSMKAVPGPAACREYTRQLDGGLGSMLPAGFSNQSY